MSDNLELCKKVDELSESHEEEVKRLKRLLEVLQDEIEDYKFIREQGDKRISALERDIVVRDTKILELSSQSKILVKGNFIFKKLEVFLLFFFQGLKNILRPRFWKFLNSWMSTIPLGRKILKLVIWNWRGLWKLVLGI